jgi:hypothetical protein
MNLWDNNIDTIIYKQETSLVFHAYLDQIILNTNQWPTGNSEMTTIQKKLSKVRGNVKKDNINFTLQSMDRFFHFISETYTTISRNDILGWDKLTN